MDADAIKTIVDSLTKPAMINIDAEHAFALLPEGTTIEDVRKFLPPSKRVKQEVELLTVGSFTEYVSRFALADTTVFANEPLAQYEAVIDYHRMSSVGEGRGTQEHIVRYACPQSEQWKAWVGSNGKWFNQVDFATFLESNLKEITDPPGAVFLQVALELQVHKSAEFESEVRLDNGQTRFRYQETVRGQSKAGDLQIPSAFTLVLPVFIDGDKHILQARFRYRMDGGKLSLGYELIRQQDVWNAAVKLVTTAIADDLPEVKLYVGKRR